MRAHLYSLPALSALLVLAGCAESAEELPPAPTPVHAVEASSGPAAPTIRTSGMLANKDEFRLAFKVGGVIKRIAVNEGDQVRAGQKLAEIEQTEIQAQVEQARQAHEKALRDFERGERLYADKVISLEQLQDLKTQTAVAAAALNAAQFNRMYAAIVAPHDGTVLRRLAEERELVSAGAPILVLGAKEQGFIVRAGLADREIVQVQSGDRAEIRLDAFANETFHGTVTEIASAADPGSGLFNVEVAVQAPKAPLRSGLVAKLHLLPSAGRAQPKVYVPIAAIVEGEGRRASVFVIDAGHARRREVQVAFIEHDRVALDQGLAAGERVVTDGALYLEDGEAVSVEQALAQAR
jgi:RND family efflux transporter MFP subunit